MPGGAGGGSGEGAGLPVSASELLHDDGVGVRRGEPDAGRRTERDEGRDLANVCKGSRSSADEIVGYYCGVLTRLVSRVLNAVKRALNVTQSLGCFCGDASSCFCGCSGDACFGWLRVRRVGVVGRRRCVSLTREGHARDAHKRIGLDERMGAVDRAAGDGFSRADD